jgi:hypothetical protein
MEGSGGGQAQSAQPPTPSKKDAFSLLGIIIGAILIVAIVVTPWPSSTPSYGWTPQKGNFFEYSVNVTGHMGGVPIYRQSLSKQTVKAVYGNLIVWNVTSNQNGHNHYEEHSLPLNHPLRPNIYLNNPPSDITLQKVGTESIITKWGSLSTDHYEVVESAWEGGPPLGWGDIWIRHGVALKAIWSDQLAFTYTYYLSDTNIPGVTS